MVFKERLRAKKKRSPDNHSELPGLSSLIGRTEIIYYSFVLFRSKAPLPFAIVQFRESRLKLCVQVYPAFELSNCAARCAVREIL